MRKMFKIVCVMALLAYTLAAPAHEDTKSLLQPDLQDPNSHIQLIDKNPLKSEEPVLQSGASRDIKASVELKPEPTITKRETEDDKPKILPTQSPLDDKDDKLPQTATVPSPAKIKRETPKTDNILAKENDIKKNQESEKFERETVSTPSTPIEAAKKDTENKDDKKTQTLTLASLAKFKRETTNRDNIPTLGNSQVAANNNYLKNKNINQRTPQSSPIQTKSDKLKRETVSAPSTPIETIKKDTEPQRIPEVLENKDDTLVQKATVASSPKVKRETTKTENIPSQVATNENDLKNKKFEEKPQQSSTIQNHSDKLKRETVSAPSKPIETIKKDTETQQKLTEVLENKDDILVQKATVASSPKVKRETPKTEIIPAQVATNENDLKNKKFEEKPQQTSTIQTHSDKLKRETVSAPSTPIEASKKITEPQKLDFTKNDPKPLKIDQTTTPTKKRPNNRRRKPSTVAVDSSTASSVPVIVTPTAANIVKNN